MINRDDPNIIDVTDFHPVGDDDAPIIDEGEEPAPQYYTQSWSGEFRQTQRSGGGGGCCCGLTLGFLTIFFVSLAALAVLGWAVFSFFGWLF